MALTTRTSWAPMPSLASAWPSARSTLTNSEQTLNHCTKPQIHRNRCHHGLQAGAAHKGVPLYRHIADLAGVKHTLLMFLLLISHSLSSGEGRPHASALPQRHQRRQPRRQQACHAGLVLDRPQIETTTQRVCVDLSLLVVETKEIIF